MTKESLIKYKTNISAMERTVFLILFIITAVSSSGQYYVALAPSLTNTAGTIGEKSNITLEFGKQWDVFSLGALVGKTSMSKVTGRDTTLYTEIRPNLNIFQQGKFTNTFTAGIGYIFNAEENLVTELTSGIEYAQSEQFHINISFGQYFYSGRYSASNVTFFGISGMWYFGASHTNSLIRNKSPKPG